MSYAITVGHEAISAVREPISGKDNKLWFNEEARNNSWNINTFTNKFYKLFRYYLYV